MCALLLERAAQRQAGQRGPQLCTQGSRSLKLSTTETQQPEAAGAEGRGQSSLPGTAAGLQPSCSAQLLRELSSPSCRALHLLAAGTFLGCSSAFAPTPVGRSSCRGPESKGQLLLPLWNLLVSSWGWSLGHLCPAHPHQPLSQVHCVDFHLGFFCFLGHFGVKSWTGSCPLSSAVHSPASQLHTTCPTSPR